MATVGVALRSTFNDTIVVTGRDHPEHVSLYGRGSAIVPGPEPHRDGDVTGGTSFLKGRRPGQGLLDRRRAPGAQIAAARARGWNDRAGTGLHLHIDRFRDRRGVYGRRVARSG
ncbi:MAG: hypothetical protein R2882_04455 [Gemmatimonadales bacterium]